MKFCGYYCTWIIMVNFLFFGILIFLIKERNWRMIQNLDKDIYSKIKAITITMIVNGICLLGCEGYLVQVEKQEKR